MQIYKYLVFLFQKDAHLHYFRINQNTDLQLTFIEVILFFIFEDTKNCLNDLIGYYSITDQKGVERL